MIILGIMSLAGTQLNAQLTHTSNEYHASGTGSDVEFATTGNIMPYKVTPFHWGPLTELMKPSTFKRWLNRNTTGYKFLKADGTIHTKDISLFPILPISA